jgi:hypothetical protein
MAEVHKVNKDGRNKHDGYNFASIDDFLALVNPICAANGLVVHMQEGERQDFERQGRNGATAWMRQSFDLTLYHVSGQTMPPVTRTVEVLRNGAQAYGSAQSYALKQFWRCTLLIPTGDKDDADYQPTDAGTVSNTAPEPRKPVRPTAPDDDAIANASEYMAEADSLDELRRRWGALPVNVRAAPAVIAAKDARKADLEKPADDLDGDQIPY